MMLHGVERLLDAVLLEGYLLYPYRASALKNQYRWTFGVLAPRSWSESGGTERWWIESQVLVRAGEGAEVTVRLRFLHLERRRVEEQGRDGAFRAVRGLESGDRLELTWDEAVRCEEDLRVGLDPGGSRAHSVLVSRPGGREVEALAGAGSAPGRVVRERAALEGRLSVGLRPGRAEGLHRVTTRVENLTPFAPVAAPREEILPACLIAAHLVYSISNGELASVVDPAPWAQGEIEGLESKGTYFSLAGPRGAGALGISSPIILQDYPEVAPESPGDFHDAAEIDELLTLRTATLTDEEKREARATDPRAAEILERVEAAGPAELAALHGARRRLDARGEMIAGPAPPPGALRRGALGEPGSQESVARCIGAYQVGRQVRLRPGSRRTDAQDFLFAGRVATIEEVLEDSEGRGLLAVLVDDDPATEAHRWYGRRHYYHLDEVEPVEPAPEEGP